MHMTIHPSQWFHHEHVLGEQTPSTHGLMEGLRQLFHSGVFWVLIAALVFFGLMMGLAIIFGENPSTTVPQGPYAPYYLP